MFLIFKRHLLHPIPHLTMTEDSHSLDFPNNLAVSQWQIINMDPLFIMIAVVNMAAVLANVLGRIFVLDRVGDLILLHVHIKDLKICSLQV